MADERTIRGELEGYLKERDLNEYFTSIIESCLLAQPENPSMHITKHLFSKFPGQFPLQVRTPLSVSKALYSFHVGFLSFQTYLHYLLLFLLLDWPSPRRCGKGRGSSPTSSDGKRGQG